MMKDSKVFVFLIGVIGYFSLVNIVWILRYLLEIIVYEFSESVVLTAIAPLIVYIGSLILLLFFYKKSDYFIILFEKRIVTFISIFILSFLLKMVFFLLYASITIPEIIEKSMTNPKIFNHEGYTEIFSNMYMYILKIVILFFIIKEGVVYKRRIKKMQKNF